jgi:hypothetical protein
MSLESVASVWYPLEPSPRAVKISGVATLLRSMKPSIHSPKDAAARVWVFIEPTRPASAGLFLFRLGVLRLCVR